MYKERIQKFDNNSKFITQWGSNGNDTGQFNSPNGVAVDSSGNVYVADNGTGPGQFIYVSGIAVDSSNNVYVGQNNNNRIQKFDNNSKFITQWGSNGNDTGQFNSPNGVAVDSSGNVYVADDGNGRIQVFAPKQK